MVIDRTKIKPSYYIEINGVDVSEFVVDRGFFSPSSKEKITRARFILDGSIDLNIKRYNTVSFYLQYDTKFKMFGGVISNVTDNQDFHRIEIDVRSFEWATYETTFTGVFRNDAGKGNRKTIVTDILLEKFPWATWDIDSFPDISSDEDIIYKIYNNKKPATIFDELLLSLKRDWWFDENGKFFARPRDYVQVNQPINVNVQTIGLPIIEINNRYTNIVKVFGATFEKYLTHEFSGTGSTDEFDLDFTPAGSSDVEYTDGTRISVTMEGNDDYDDSAEYDAYFKVSDRKLKFNINTTIGSDNIIVKTKVHDQISEEVFSATEIDRIGREVVKKISDPNIQTSEEAYKIGQNYLDTYAKDLDIFRLALNITSDDELDNWRNGNSVPVDINNGKGLIYTDIVEVVYAWSSGRKIIPTARFVDSPINDNDVLQDLINSIRREEEKLDSTTTSVTRFFYLGANIVFGIQNLSIELQDTDGSFEAQEVDPDVRSWMTDGGTTPFGGSPAIMSEEYSTAKRITLSSNTNNKFIESFLDEWFIDDSTADLDENLALLLKCDDDLASTNVIESIAGNDGTSNQNTDNMSVPGFVDKALSFNGTSDGITMPNDILDFINDEDFSVSFRFNTSWIATGATDIIAWIGGGKWILIRYSVIIGNNITVQYYDGTTTRYCYLTSGINDGLWKTIQFIINRSGNMEGYVDNILSSNVQDISSAIIGTGITQSFTIMNSPFTIPMEGLIDDIRIYRELLDSTKRQSIIDNPRFIGEKSNQTYILNDGEELISKEIFAEEGSIVNGSSINFDEVSGTNTTNLEKYVSIDSSGFHLVNGTTINSLNGTFIKYKLLNTTGSQSIVTAVKIDYIPQVI